MQDGPDVAPHETDRGARSDQLHAAQARQIGDEIGEQRAVQRVRRRIERNRHVGLRGRDEVHGHPVFLEYLECVREKADLVPHAGALERDQRNALLRADRFDLCRPVEAFRAEHGALQIGRLGRVDVKRDAVLADRHDTAWVQNLGSAGGDLLRLVVVKCA